MKIIGHGIDLVDVARIAEMIERHGERFMARVFTEAERAYAQANPHRRFEHLAGRFAAKEAALKALGTGWSGGIAWREIAVTRQPSGQPTLVVSGRAGEVAAERGITGWLVSLSHTTTHAVASVIAVA